MDSKPKSKLKGKTIILQLLQKWKQKIAEFASFKHDQKEIILIISSYN